MRVIQLRHRMPAFIGAIFIALCARGESVANRVSVDHTSFNPSLGGRVSVTVKAMGDSRISIAVIDRDGYVVRSLANGISANDTYVATWDGRDASGAVVADEAYSFKVDVSSDAGRWTYFPAAIAPNTYPVEAKHYSRRDAALMYQLPAAARLHAQAGSAVIDTKTKTYDGPVLKTLVNREPRPAGAIVESWNGFDESGVIYVPDLPEFVTAILATELPENAVIAFGNRARTFLDVAASRRGTSLLPAVKAHSHAQHYGLEALDDVSPSLAVEPLNGTWDEERKAWHVGGASVLLRIQLAGRTAANVARQPGKIVVFIDYKQTSERTVRGPSETIEVELPKRLPGRPSRPHVVSINWQSEYGPLAASSIHVTTAVTRTSPAHRSAGAAE